MRYEYEVMGKRYSKRRLAEAMAHAAEAWMGILPMRIRPPQTQEEVLESVRGWVTVVPMWYEDLQNDIDELLANVVWDRMQEGRHAA